MLIQQNTNNLTYQEMGSIYIAIVFLIQIGFQEFVNTKKVNHPSIFFARNRLHNLAQLFVLCTRTG